MDVACAETLLEKLRLQAVEGLNRLAHGGLEIGGVLFGRRDGQSLEILDVQPIECEHQRGPSFVLSPADEASLQAILATSSSRQQQVLGLYISHSRKGFLLTETDIDILNRYFPEPWQFALVLVPALSGPTRAGIFARGSAGDPAIACVHELQLSPIEPNPEKSESPPRPIVSQAISKAQAPAGDTPAPQPATVALVKTVAAPLPETIPVRVLPLVPSFSVLEQRPSRRWYIAPALVLLFLGAGVMGGLRLSGRIGPYLRPSVHVSDLGSTLRFEWDPDQDAIRGAISATLEIRDGSMHAVTIPVSRGGVHNGSILYAPQSGMVEARLRFNHFIGPASESVIYFFNPNYVSAPPPPLRSPVVMAESIPDLPRPPAEPLPPYRTESVQRNTRRPEELPAERVVTPARNTEKLPPFQPPARNAEKLRPFQPPARNAEKLRPFQPPAKQLSSHLQTRAATALPELPEIRMSQPALPALPLTNVPTPPPASPPTPSRPQVQPLPREGRLIWTGDLRKNGMLSFSGAGVSEGALNGRLPGFPIRISVQPAELSPDGIRIFSADRTRSGIREQPSAQNGWNAVVYKWDPKRASEVTVIEPPRPSNNWKQLVVRNGRSNISVLVVEWQRVGSQ